MRQFLTPLLAAFKSNADGSLKCNSIAWSQVPGVKFSKHLHWR